MKWLLCGLLLLLGSQSFAAVTNELCPSDLASLYFESDYGAFILRAKDILPTPAWDADSEPPLSAVSAIRAVKPLLPTIINDEWLFRGIGLHDFENKGWFYLVHFDSSSVMTHIERVYVVTKTYTAAVLMDGRVIVPSEKADWNNECVEQSVPDYDPQGVPRNGFISLHSLSLGPLWVESEP